MSRSSETWQESTARIIQDGLLRKIVFSRYNDSSIKRSEARLLSMKEGIYLQIETFLADGKAIHRNYPQIGAASAVENEFGKCRQMNILTAEHSMEVKKTKKGAISVTGGVASAPLPIPPHNHVKKNILSDGTRYDFLIALGVSDEKGVVFDRFRAKFRQIDRFLHYVDEIYPRLQAKGELFVLDLCCGKSYLTFACYWYLTAIRHRTVKMIGIDRKPDVISFCADLADALSYEGLSFACMDILTYEPPQKPALVLSLHACDIATDIVLTTAARLSADVILSTPCCHHQFFNEFRDSSPLGKLLAPVSEFSLLKQKVCVALTDALRCKRLQAAGYAVDVTELIDPENTPKNLMIRAYRHPITDEKKRRYQAEFDALSALCEVSLFNPNCQSD